ncbi:glutamate-5-semialdehyde dehydrogenase [Paraflavitalea sp. CAU 1676]|uniref:glutamate-5-semialdehyde dehydrogenase n=1 Tax=Paraflavitalea sp. CAU 1676 TaxID=3032598 RepID=UPI0023DB02D4|nr:glutamate-5-semialdehyde dehydrogenase [Paraflavitalea sp. CAU 1676]MDF2190399.1 glutamate-5-semialdehyde dehydrogenase [Paraflavitalea sp. CAU 1676]
MKTILPLLAKTHKAATSLQALSGKQLQQTLRSLAEELVKQSATLLKANALDLAKQDPGNPRNDRLLLTPERIKNIASSIKKVAGLPDPTGQVLAKRTLPNGLQLEKISVPLGVVGAIYESRPNVTFDIAALCLRSRNACVLKGSSEAAHTNEAGVKIIKKVLKDQGINPEVVALLPPAREVVDQLFTATQYIDVLIPRGSDSLIQYVRKNSLVPVIETGAGVCHVYVHSKADAQMAAQIVVNAKTSRPSVCNAMDTLLIDKSIAGKVLKLIQPGFKEKEVEVFADTKAHAILKNYPHLQKAKPADFDREFLSQKCAIKVVDDIEEALAHIAIHSTKHSEAIVSADKAVSERFIREVDAAAVYSNASTRFTDGEEFGLGAEIGISTQKLHARGPFALEKLVTEKWVIRGKGQIR